MCTSVYSSDSVNDYMEQKKKKKQKMVDSKGQFSAPMNLLAVSANLNRIKLCCFKSTAVSLGDSCLDFT